MYMMMSMKTLGLVVALGVSGSLPALSNGEIIYNNDITDSNPSAFNPFTAGDVVASNLTASGIGRGPGLSGNAGSNRYNAAQFSTTLDTSDYFGWTLTPATNYSIDFTSVSGNWQRSGTGPNSYSLQYSTNGGSSFTLIQAGAITGSSSAVAFNISLGAPALNTIATPIVFRLYAFGSTSTSGTFSVNDFAFDGSLAPIPEPASLGLLSLGGLVALRRRRA
jgi:hypothetical protein